jgi:hypothetical protein
MHEPSLSHKHLRLACLRGALSPSRRRIHSTHLAFTSPPARRHNRAVIRL